MSSAKRAALRPTPLAFVRASGGRITDVDGNEYVDYVAGYGRMLLGHQPPAVLDAVRGPTLRLPRMSSALIGSLHLDWRSSASSLESVLSRSR